MLAILGTSAHCIATNPTDMGVAMVALEAAVQVRGLKGPRAIPIGNFHLLPGSTPNRETVLEPGDLVYVDGRLGYRQSTGQDAGKDKAPATLAVSCFHVEVWQQAAVEASFYLTRRNLRKHFRCRGGVMWRPRIV